LKPKGAAPTIRTGVPKGDRIHRRSESAEDQAAAADSLEAIKMGPRPVFSGNAEITTGADFLKRAI
jgi:hypothetical protein